MGMNQDEIGMDLVVKDKTILTRRERRDHTNRDDAAKQIRLAVHSKNASEVVDELTRD